MWRGGALSATRATDVGATLTGNVRNTEDGLTRYRFEYGPTEAYGSTTPWRSTEMPGAFKYVSDVAGGLAHGTLYHYRLCAQDEFGRGACGKPIRPWPPRTGSTRSSAKACSSISASRTMPRPSTRTAARWSGARGSAWILPGSLVPRVADSGVVTCLRVEGTRATVGFDITPISGDDPSGGALVFVKDNGADPDYMTHTTVATPPTTCPAATDDRFLFPAPPGVPPAFLPLA